MREKTAVLSEASSHRVGRTAVQDSFEELTAVVTELADNLVYYVGAIVEGHDVETQLRKKAFFGKHLGKPGGTWCSDSSAVDGMTATQYQTPGPKSKSRLRLHCCF